MYRYDEFDETLVRERVSQFQGQVARPRVGGAQGLDLLAASVVGHHHLHGLDPLLGRQRRQTVAQVAGVVADGDDDGDRGLLTPHG